MDIYCYLNIYGFYLCTVIFHLNHIKRKTMKIVYYIIVCQILLIYMR